MNKMKLGIDELRSPSLRRIITGKDNLNYKPGIIVLISVFAIILLAIFLITLPETVRIMGRLNTFKDAEQAFGKDYSGKCIFVAKDSMSIVDKSKIKKGQMFIISVKGNNVQFSGTILEANHNNNYLVLQLATTPNGNNFNKIDTALNVELLVEIGRKRIVNRIIEEKREKSEIRIALY